MVDSATIEQRKRVGARLYLIAAALFVAGGILAATNHDWWQLALAVVSALLLSFSGVRQLRRHQRRTT